MGSQHLLQQISLQIMIIHLILLQQHTQNVLTPIEVLIFVMIFTNQFVVHFKMGQKSILIVLVKLVKIQKSYLIIIQLVQFLFITLKTFQQFLLTVLKVQNFCLKIVLLMAQLKFVFLLIMAQQLPSIQNAWLVNNRIFSKFLFF